MPTTSLANLERGIREAKIKCRVSRIWDCTNPMLQNQLLSVDLMFVDEEGTAIQATVRPRDAQWLRDSVEEGHVYICSGFIVIAATTKYRVCRNPSIISLARGTTTFLECETATIPDFPLNSFSFTDYHDLPDRAYDNDFLTDVIGQLTSMGPIEEIYVKNTAVETRSIELQNIEGGTICATLWTNVAHQINDEHILELMAHGSIIMILAAVSVTKYSGKAKLSSKSATKVYINLSHPATKNFQQGLTDPPKFTLIPAGMTLEQQMKNNRKTVSELLLLQPRLHKGIKFTCEATIKDIHPFDGWWFPACPSCKKKVKLSGDIYWCDNCNTYTDDTPAHWYKLDLVVADHSADCIFMVIGRHAESIVGQTAFDLASNNPDPLILPHAIKELKGMSKIFEIELMHRNSPSNTSHTSPISFKVTRTFNAPPRSEQPTGKKTKIKSNSPDEIVHDDCSTSN